MRATDRPARPSGTWRLGRVGGTDFLARPSLLVMGAVLVVLFAPRFDASTGLDPYLVAGVFVVALYASVLLHELAHLAAARAFGMRVPSVTLHLLGGETAIEGESRTPWQELATAVVGPLASVLIGLGALLLVGPMDAGATRDVLWSVGWVNLLVAAFNLLPGLPLDGGRVFRALVWQVTGREALGVRVAAWAGRLTAVALVVGVLLARERLGERWIVDLLIAGFVATFLWQGAGAALRVAERAGRINTLHAGRLAEPLAPHVPTDLPALSQDLQGTALLRAMITTPADTYLVVDPAGAPVGVLRATRVDDAYRSSR